MKVSNPNAFVLIGILAGAITLTTTLATFATTLATTRAKTLATKLTTTHVLDVFFNGWEGLKKSNGIFH